MRYTVLRFILRKLARVALRRYKPTIIAVTGSVGKTSTRRAIMAVLKAQYHDRVRSTVGNLNTEIGVPLAILGLSPGGRSLFKWTWQLFRGFRVALFSPKYPEVLVLEMSANKPGNIYELSQLAPPNIAVVTEIGEIPMNVEYYAGPKNLAREQARVVEALPVDGWAILNRDDPTVAAMRDRTGAHVRTYGFPNEANKIDVMASAFELRSRSEGGHEVPDGVSFKIEYKGKFVPVRLYGTFGRGIVRAALAGAAVGLALNMNLVEISEALADFEGPQGRLRLVKGIKRAYVVDDSYNASPPSLEMALKTLRLLPAKRRIAVLGDMRGLGKFSEAAHQRVGTDVAGSADVLVTIGERMRIAVDSAISNGMFPENTKSFSTTKEASAAVVEMMKPGDVVLVSGSRALGLERIVKDIESET